MQHCTPSRMVSLRDLLTCAHAQGVIVLLVVIIMYDKVLQNTVWFCALYVGFALLYLYRALCWAISMRTLNFVVGQCVCVPVISGERQMVSMPNLLHVTRFVVSTH